MFYLKKELYRKGVMGAGVDKLTVMVGGGVKKFSVGDEGVKKLRRGRCRTISVWWGSKKKVVNYC